VEATLCLIIPDQEANKMQWKVAPVAEAIIMQCILMPTKYNNQKITKTILKMSRVVPPQVHSLTQVAPLL